MSKPKLQLVPQPKPQAEVVRHAPDTLDFTRAIIVNRERLAETLRDARHISGVLHNVQNLGDLSWEEMTDLCRTAYRAARSLAAMLETEGGGRAMSNVYSPA